MESLPLIMSFSQYIYGPITTEKAINEVEQFGRYSLLVNKKATKPLIKELVETVWNVKVTHISMSVIPKKRGTRGMRETKRSSAKRAIITLSPGETINLFDSVLQA